MNDQIQETESSEPDALQILKDKADILGIKYGPRIGAESLRMKIAAKLNDEPDPDEEETKAETVASDRKLSKTEIEAKIRQETYERNMKLVRLRISNLNPAKKDQHGEILTVANKFLGIVKKYIPYGEASEEGYHVPYCLYLQLKKRRFLQIKTRTVKGQIEVLTKWVPEFALEVLDPLTPKELNHLRNAQAAAAGMTE